MESKVRVKWPSLTTFAVSSSSGQYTSQATSLNPGYSSVLAKTTEYHYGRDLVLPHHPPEVEHGLLDGPLGSNEHVRFLGVGVLVTSSYLYVVRVDVGLTLFEVAGELDDVLMVSLDSAYRAARPSTCSGAWCPGSCTGCPGEPLSCRAR